MFKRIMNLFILFGLTIGVSIWAYRTFKDYSVLIILTTSSFTIIMRIVSWPFNEWLSVIMLYDKQNHYKQNKVEIIGETSSVTGRFSTSVTNLSDSKEIENYFKFKVFEKETRDYLVELNNNMIFSLLISIVSAGAAILVGYININNTHNIDSSKLMYAFIPITFQLCNLIIPFLHIKKRNEKALVPQ